MLTFESSRDKSHLEIHGDKKGLLKLAGILIEMADKNESEHRHLLTGDWGGVEINNDKQGVNNDLFHHIKICIWKGK